MKDCKWYLFKIFLMVFFVVMNSILVSPSTANAETWSQINLGEYGSKDFVAVGGTSPSNVFLGYENRILKYDGSSLTPMTFSSSTWVRDISSDLAITAGKVFQVAGDTWVEQPVTTSGILSFVKVSLSPTGGLAEVVGNNGHILRREGGVWNSYWLSGSRFNCVYVADDTHCYEAWIDAFSGNLSFVFKYYDPELGYWQTGKWFRGLSDLGIMVADVWGNPSGASAGEVYTVGLNTIGYFNGNSWTLMDHPFSNNAYLRFSGIVSHGGTLYAYGSDPWGRILKLSGGVWMDVTPENAAPIYDMESIGGYLFAAGQGQVWALAPPPAPDVNVSFTKDEIFFGDSVDVTIELISPDGSPYTPDTQITLTLTDTDPIGDMGELILTGNPVTVTGGKKTVTLATPAAPITATDIVYTPMDRDVLKGEMTIRAEGTFSGQTKFDEKKLKVESPIDLVVKEIEINQGVKGATPYIADHPTLVRVFVDARFERNNLYSVEPTLRKIQGVLHVRDSNGIEIAGSPFELKPGTPDEPVHEGITYSLKEPFEWKPGYIPSEEARAKNSLNALINIKTEGEFTLQAVINSVTDFAAEDIFPENNQENNDKTVRGGFYKTALKYVLYNRAKGIFSADFPSRIAMHEHIERIYNLYPVSRSRLVFIPESDIFTVSVASILGKKTLFLQLAAAAARLKALNFHHNLIPPATALITFVGDGYLPPGIFGVEMWGSIFVDASSVDFDLTTAAHEFGHALGLGETYFEEGFELKRSCRNCVYASPWNVAAGNYVEPGNFDFLDYQEGTGQQGKVLNMTGLSTPDLMGKDGAPGMDWQTWEYLYTAFKTDTMPPPEHAGYTYPGSIPVCTIPVICAGVTRDATSVSATRQSVQGAVDQQKLSATVLSSQGEHIILSGLVDAAGQYTLLPSIRLNGSYTASVSSTGDYSVELQDSAGTPIDTYTWTQSFQLESNPPTIATDTPFLITMSYPSNLNRIVYKYMGTSMKTVAVSAAAPVVTVTAPNGGEVISGTYEVKWSATDADGDPMTYDVLLSSDNGATWNYVAQWVESTGYTWDTSTTGGCTHCLIRVTASDGINQGGDNSNGVFTISRKNPETIITLPAEGRSVVAGNNIVFRGVAFDPEDGVITTDASFLYSSDKDGVIGTGAEIVTSRLSTAAHVITLTVTDSDGNTGTDTMHLTILADSDGDGMDDTWETQNGLDTDIDDSAANADGDGLTNLEEYENGTHPKSSDSDNDGVTDGTEVSLGFDPTDSTSKPSGAGSVRFDKSTYVSQSDIGIISVTDPGLSVDATTRETIDVTVTSSSDPTGVILTLKESGTDTGFFSSYNNGANLRLSLTASSVSTIRVADGDVITVTYTDADDGQGNMDVAVTATAAFMIDNTPPSSVTDLFGTSGDEPHPLSVVPTTSYVTLTWTAPGDGNAGTGGAESYIIKCAKGNIVETGALPGEVNWSDANYVFNSPNPETAGTPQRLVVSGLSVGEQYCFAMKSVDDAGNFSTISNVATVTVNTHPIAGADINGDGNVDLIDAILVLKIECLLSPDPIIYHQADVNGDSKIGMEEGIYILQKELGLR